MTQEQEELTDDHMDNKIESIILDYCEGLEYLEFSRCEMPDMIREIKEAILGEIEQAEEDCSSTGMLIHTLESSTFTGWPTT